MCSGAGIVPLEISSKLGTVPLEISSKLGTVPLEISSKLGTVPLEISSKLGSAGHSIRPTALSWLSSRKAALSFYGDILASKVFFQYNPLVTVCVQIWNACTGSKNRITTTLSRSRLNRLLSFEGLLPPPPRPLHAQLAPGTQLDMVLSPALGDPKASQCPNFDLCRR